MACDGIWLRLRFGKVHGVHFQHQCISTSLQHDSDHAAYDYPMLHQPLIIAFAPRRAQYLHQGLHGDVQQNVK
jgi:hypothetical protein